MGRFGDHFAAAAVVFVTLVVMPGCAPRRTPNTAIELVDVPPFSSRRPVGQHSPDDSIAAEAASDEAPESPPSRFCIDELADGIGLPDDNDRIKRFDEMLRAEFRAQGYETVSSAALNETWDQVFESSDDIFDPHTGQQDDQQLKQTRLDALAALHKDHGCDFLVTTQIVFVSAAWKENRVAWDGIEAQFTEGLNPGAGYAGYVGAISLRLRISNLDDELVHFGTGGIQVTSQLKGGFVTDTFIGVDADQLLTNDELNISAVRRALDAMKSRAKPEK